MSRFGHSDFFKKTKLETASAHSPHASFRQTPASKIPRHAISGTSHRGPGGNAVDLKPSCSSEWNAAKKQSQYWVPASGYIAMFISKNFSLVSPKL